MPLVGVGDGGLASDLDDIAQFWRALFDGSIVSTATAVLMTTPHADASEYEARYGLGFWLHPSGPAIRIEGYDAGISFRSWQGQRDNPVDAAKKAVILQQQGVGLSGEVGPRRNPDGLFLFGHLDHTHLGVILG
jgi:CubicO group peptidase (beta-lactamase class C family)